VKIRFAFVAAFAVMSVLPINSASAGKKTDKSFVMVNEEVGLPVFPHDITDRPYEVVGEVRTSVRKATIFSKAPSQDKIYRELWERGEKLGADAVIKAQYGDAHVTLMSWGASTATGIAIKFKPAPATEATAPAEATAETAAGPGN
jgi:hypothetical protein